MMIFSIIKNETRYEAKFMDFAWRLKHGAIAPHETHKWRIDEDATYREWRVRVGASTNTITISSDDLIDLSEVIIRENPDGTFLLVGTKRRDSELIESAKVGSLKLVKALRSIKALEKLCKRVKICHHQCNHLLHTYKEGIQKMAQLYSRFVENYKHSEIRHIKMSLRKLETSLDSLEYIVCDAKDLLSSCATELGKVALVVSSRIPPVEKDTEVYSDFDLLIRELEWHLDVMEYLMEPSGPSMFEWSPTMCRYVLKRRVVAQVNLAPDQKKPRSFACMDYEELRSGIEDGSIYIPNTIYAYCARQFFGLGKKNLDATVLKRCKAHNLQSGAMDLKDFEIDHLDLHPCTNGRLGEGSFKKVYKGKWYGQSVAIATIRMDDPDTASTLSKMIKDEVNGLLQLQHPKVVSLFGWAETTDALAPIKEPDEKYCVQGGYIVTEKMEYSLDKLIKMQNRGSSRNDSGPFSYSVQIDILLQIVVSMLHVQNRGVMHRDLKPDNFLVNPRSSPARPGADTYYNVKLIDFGSSKVYVTEDGNTYNRGTTTYGAPEMMKGSEREADHGKYGPSVDVFSFAMTCYQVITGTKPFQGTDAARAIRNKERPEFPLTVLQPLRELTEECWNENPEERPSFKEIQERLWTIKMKLAVN